MKKSDMYTSTRAILAFLVLAISFSVFVLFVMNQDAIIGSNNFTPFIMLVILGSALLISLMYFASQTKEKVARTHSSKNKKR